MLQAKTKGFEIEPTALQSARHELTSATSVVERLRQRQLWAASTNPEDGHVQQAKTEVGKKLQPLLEETGGKPRWTGVAQKLVLELNQFFRAMDAVPFFWSNNPFPVISLDAMSELRQLPEELAAIAGRQGSGWAAGHATEAQTLVLQVKDMLEPWDLAIRGGWAIAHETRECISQLRALKSVADLRAVLEGSCQSAKCQTLSADASAPFIKRARACDAVAQIGRAHV